MLNVFEKIWKQTVEKIVKSENSKFRKITIAEIQKLVKLCKNEQVIVNWTNIVKNVTKQIWHKVMWQNIKLQILWQNFDKKCKFVYSYCIYCDCLYVVPMTDVS